MSNTPKPTVGRTVHFQRTADGPPEAAIVSAVHQDGTVSLHAAWNNAGHPWKLEQRIPHADKPTPGAWNWPPQVPAPAAEDSESESDKGDKGNKGGHRHGK